MAVDNEKLEMVMSLIDDVTPTLKKIRNEIGKTQEESEKPIGSGVRNGISKLKESFNGLNGAIKGFLGLYAVKKIADMGAYAINAASDMVELQNVTDQVFGKMADNVQKFAERTGEAMGRSTYSMKKYVSDMATVIKGIDGISEEQMKKMSEDLAVKAVDMGSFMNVEDDRAFNALRGAISGETEALKTLGVVINDTVMAEYALNHGIKEKWTNLDLATKAQLRYQAIMEKTSFMEGDAARTIDSYSNQIKVFQANMNNLAVTIGSKFQNMSSGVLGGINSIIGGLNELLQKNTADKFLGNFITETNELKNTADKYMALSRMKIESSISNEGEEERLALYNKLITLHPELKNQISSEASEWNKVNEAIKGVIDSLKEKYKEEMRNDFFEKNKNKIVKAQKAINQKSDEYNVNARDLISKTGISEEAINNLTSSKNIRSLLYSHRDGIGSQNQAQILAEFKKTTEYTKLSIKDQQAMEKQFGYFLNQVRKLAGIKGEVERTSGMIRKDLADGTKELNDNIRAFESGVNTVIEDTSTGIYYTIAQNATQSLEAISGAVQIAENNLYDSEGRIRQEVLDAKFALLSQLANYTAVFGGTSITKDKNGYTASFGGKSYTFSKEENAKAFVIEQAKKSKEYGKKTPKIDRPQNNHENNKIRGNTKSKKKHKGSRGEKNKSKNDKDDKWEQLEKNLITLDKELNNLIIPNSRLDKIKELSEKVREKQFKNLNELGKMNILEPIDIFNEKIKLLENSITQYSELINGTKDITKKNSLNAKIKELKGQLNNLKLDSILQPLNEHYKLDELSKLRIVDPSEILSVKIKETEEAIDKLQELFKNAKDNKEKGRIHLEINSLKNKVSKYISESITIEFEKSIKEIENLSKLGLKNPTETINEKIEATTKTLNTITENLKDENKLSSSEKGILISKFKSLKESLKNLNEEAKQLNLIKSLDEQIQDLNFSLNEENKKIFDEKTATLINAELKKLEEEKKLNLLNESEYLNKKLEIYRKAKENYSKSNNTAEIEYMNYKLYEIDEEISQEQASKLKDLYQKGKITVSAYLQGIISLGETKLKKMEETGYTQDYDNTFIEKYNNEIKLKLNNLQEQLFKNKVLGQIKVGIEELSSFELKKINIDNAKREYEASVDLLMESIANAKDDTKALIKTIDFTKPFNEVNQQLNDLIEQFSEEPIDIARKETLIAIKNLYKKTREDYEKYKNVSDGDINKTIKNVEDNIKFGLDNIKKLAKSLEADDLTDTLDGLINTMVDITKAVAYAFAGDAEQATKSAISALTSIFSKLFEITSGKYAKKAEADYKARESEINENTRALRELRDSLKSIGENLIKSAAQNTSKDNIKYYKEYSQALNEVYAKNFNPNLMINGVAHRSQKFNFGNFLLSYWTFGLSNLFSEKKENVAYTKKFRDLFKYDNAKTSDDLQKIYDEKIKNLEAKDLSKFLDKEDGAVTEWRLENVNSNLDQIKKEFQNKINFLRKQENEVKKFEENVLLESLDGVSVVDKAAKKREMLNNFKSIYKDNENLEEMIPEFEKKIDEMLAKQDVIVTAFDDSRNTIINNLSQGKNVIDSLANGLQSYWNKLRQNIAKIKYDLELRDLGDFENVFNDKFKKISQALVDLRLKGGSIKDLDPKQLDFTAVFKQLNDMKKTATDMTDVIKELRRQAKSQGLSDSIIDEMLPLDKIDDRVAKISDSLKKAMNAVLDTNSFNQFSMSMGQSIYENTKEALLKAFIESEKFQSIYSKYFNMNDFNEEIAKTNSISEAYSVIKNNLDKFENKLKAEGLGFRETNADNGEYLGGFINKTTSQPLTTSTLQSQGFSINITNNIDNKGFLSIEDFTSKLYEMVRQQKNIIEAKEV